MLLRRTVDGVEVTALIITFDAARNRPQQRDRFGREGAIYVSSVAALQKALTQIAGLHIDLLIINTHGAVHDHEIGHGTAQWLDVNQLSGACGTLLVIACNQSKERGKVWKDRFAATAVVHSSGSPQAAVVENAAARVLKRPHTWRDGHLVLGALLDAPPHTKYLHEAGWDVT